MTLRAEGLYNEPIHKFAIQHGGRMNGVPLMLIKFVKYHAWSTTQIKYGEAYTLAT